MATSDIPPEELHSFLQWLRIRSERAWERWPEPTLQVFELHGAGGCAWRPGSRWLGGLTEAQIEAAEQKYGLTFPEDYRVFLRTLHALDRSMFHAGFAEGDLLVEGECPAFYNWLVDDEAIAGALEWPLEGLVFDAVRSDLWFDDWGPRPSDEPEARHRLAGVLRSAPRLVPVLGHRYLVEADCPRGHVVLSVYQSDIIVYARDLRTLLLKELAELLDVPDAARAAYDHEPYRRAARQIPFWGRFLD